MGCGVCSTPQAEEPRKARRTPSEQQLREVSSASPATIAAAFSPRVCVTDDEVLVTGDRADHRDVAANRSERLPSAEACSTATCPVPRYDQPIGLVCPEEVHAAETVLKRSEVRSPLSPTSSDIEPVSVSVRHKPAKYPIDAASRTAGKSAKFAGAKRATVQKETAPAVGNTQMLRAATVASPPPEAPLCQLDDPPPAPAVVRDQNLERLADPLKAIAGRERARPVEVALAALGRDADDVSLSTDDEEPTGTQSLSAVFPQHIDVTIATRKVLLTWTRWARNSLRIAEEVRLKAIQHTRHPRTRSPHRPSPSLSPQPTPLGTPRGDASTCSGPPSPSGSVAHSHDSGRSPSSSGRSPMRVTGRGLATRRPESGAGNAYRACDASEPSSAPLFDELLREQRQSMDAQGVKIKLCRKLGADAATAKSFGTPGFGLETPNFIEGCSQGSTEASTAASAMSSGIASPCGGGQLSPWILEAEALLNDDADDDDDLLAGLAALGYSGFEGRPLPKVTAAWATSLATIADDKVQSDGKHNSPEVDVGGGANLPSSGHELDTIRDGDELDHVNLFDSVKSLAVDQSGSGDALPVGSVVAGSLERPFSEAVETLNCRRPSSAERCKNLGSGAPRHGSVRVEYKVGDTVRYWSASRTAWLPAVVVERKLRGVYLVDKQMKGCVSKVHARELVSEAEENRDHVFRAVAALGCDGPPIAKTSAADDRPSSKPTGKGSKEKRGLVSGVRPSTPLGERYRPYSVKSATTPPARGCIRRADFSSDEDAELPYGPTEAPCLTAAPHPQSFVSCAHNRGIRPATHLQLKGRVVRNDFSDDEESDG